MSSPQRGSACPGPLIAPRAGRAQPTEASPAPGKLSTLNAAKCLIRTLPRLQGYKDKCLHPAQEASESPPESVGRWAETTCQGQSKRRLQTHGWLTGAPRKSCTYISIVWGTRGRDGAGKVSLAPESLLLHQHMNSHLRYHPVWVLTWATLLRTA